MKSLLVLCFLAVLGVATRAEDPYPPAGFQRTSTAWCAQGHFLQVIYAQSPEDPAGQCQLWLEPSNSELKPQLLLAYTNRVSSFVDDSGNHLAVQHHETNTDDLLYVFYRGPKGAFQRVPTELRAAALEEFCRQTNLKLGRRDFDHFECHPDQWAEGGLLTAYIRGNASGTSKQPFHLEPWHFLYDVEHQKFVPQNFPKNKKAFVRDQP